MGRCVGWRFGFHPNVFTSSILVHRAKFRVLTGENRGYQREEDVLREKPCIATAQKAAGRYSSFLMGDATIILHRKHSKNYGVVF